MLTEADTAMSDFMSAFNDMVAINCKNNFLHFVGHEYSFQNTNKEIDLESNDSGIVSWDWYMLDDELRRLIAGFCKKTKYLFMIAECYSEGVLNSKFAIKGSSVCFGRAVRNF